MGKAACRGQDLAVRFLRIGPFKPPECQPFERTTRNHRDFLTQPVHLQVGKQAHVIYSGLKSKLVRAPQDLRKGAQTEWASDVRTELAWMLGAILM